MAKRLAKIVDQYEQSKEITSKYADQLRYTVRRYERFLGRRATKKDLAAKRVNKWLKQERDDGTLSERTRNNLRKTILTIWKSSGKALDPAEIRKVKLRPRNPEAWSFDQLTAIANAAAKINGTLPNGIRRADQLSTTIWFAYESGLRKRDIEDFDITSFGDDNTAAVTQHKVRRVHVIRITDKTRADMQRISDRLRHADDPRWMLPLRWPQSDRQFYYWMRHVRKLAGVDADVRNRSLQHLRRTGATAVELDGGKAWQFLGHSEPGLDRASYVDGIKTTKPMTPSQNRENDHPTN